MISGGALIAGLLLGGVTLADSLQNENPSFANAGYAVGLLMLGGYGLSRAKTVLERKVTDATRSRVAA